MKKQSKKANDTNKAVAYIRVSTVEQVTEGVSLAAQEERIKAYCTMTGLELVAVIRDEGVSASKELSTRPGGMELLKLVSTQGIKNIVALKLDRLFRDAADCLNQTRAWDTAGIALHLIDMGGTAINTGTAMGRFFITMAAGFAELERNMIAERTAAALAHKKANREAYSPTPMGYDREGKSLVVNQEEQEVINQIKTWRGEGHSLREIAKRLNDNGVPTKKGGKWYASTINNILGNNLHEEVA